MRRKRRLLDQHVFARGERAQREVEVKSRRHRDDHGVDARIVDGGGVVGVAAPPPNRRQYSSALARSRLA